MANKESNVSIFLNLINKPISPIMVLDSGYNNKKGTNKEEPIEDESFKLIDDKNIWCLYNTTNNPKVFEEYYSIPSNSFNGIFNDHMLKSSKVDIIPQYIFI